MLFLFSKCFFKATMYYYQYGVMWASNYPLEYMTIMADMGS